MPNEEVRKTLERLGEPFPADRLGFKPGKIFGARCIAIVYIDARDVMDRLDEVVGAENWYDECEAFGDAVRCHLHVRIAGDWIVKSDVGSESDQPDAGDRVKAAFSDALKRAAVKFGIGRYLYQIPGPLIADFDPDKKRIVKDPALPAKYLPRPPAPPVDQDDRRSGLAILETAAKNGIRAYELAFGSLSKNQLKACKDDHPKLKEQALKVTREKEGNHAALSS